MATTHPEPLPADLKFETALAELETLAARMEGGNLELEDSIAAYQRGMALLQHCQNQLKEAEERIKVLEAGTLKPFSPDGEAL
ncbi:MAG: exodeoxyribonuclease VII small subunit [Betaproteobacteria bacterium]|nr:exodeoxyribonuclease VII small subunit [Betaproteobacteria bacterium]